MAEKQRVTKAQIYTCISDCINRDKKSTLPPFPRRYYVHETSPGVRLYLRETDEEDVVEYVHEHCLANDILVWAKEASLDNDSLYLEFKHAVEAARYWRGVGSHIGDIKSIKWPYDPGLTFRKLPWIKNHADFPAFAEMFSRISNGMALKCFIGSLFFDKSNIQQYIWLYGEGQNGKGALSRFLHAVFANAYSSQTPPVGGDRFWTSMLMGKRLVVFPDCNDQKFVTGGLFKSLTGGDPVRIENKGQAASTMRMNAKYMFLSNERPELSSEKADQRRIVYCEMGPVKCETDPLYEEKLWAEGGAFLTHCMDMYDVHCYGHTPIPCTNDEILKDWISTVEQEYEVAFENNFEFKDGEIMLPSALQCRLQQIWPRSRKCQMEFLKWVERSYNIRKKSYRTGGKVLKVYPNLKLVYAGQDLNTSQERQYALQGVIKKVADTRCL